MPQLFSLRALNPAEIKIWQCLKSAFVFFNVPVMKMTYTIAILNYLGKNIPSSEGILLKILFYKRAS